MCYRMPTPVLEERVKTLDMISTLQQQPDGAFSQRMQQYVYPGLDGTDHARMLYYFTLLEGATEQEKDAEMTPQTHIRLLKKIKTAAPGTD